MADDLRLGVSVEDRFTGPLSKLKQGVRGIVDETKSGAGAMHKDWENARGAVTKFQGALQGVQPVLSAIGASSFGAVLTFGGIAAAVRSFSSDTRNLSLLSKDIGLTVDQLRAFNALGDKFGVTADTMKGAAKTLSTQMFDIKRHGETYTQLQAMNLSKLAEQLASAPDIQSAIERGMEGLRSIPDAEVRRRVSRMLFGTDDIGLIASNLHEPVKDVMKKVSESVGKMDKETEQAAQKFEERLAKFGHAAERAKLKYVGPLLKGMTDIFDQQDEAEADPKGVHLRNLTKERDDLKKLIDKSPDWQKWPLQEQLGGIDNQIKEADPDGSVRKRIQQGKPIPKSGPGSAELDARIGELEAKRKDAQERHDWNAPTAAQGEPRYVARQKELADQIKALTEEIRRLREGGGGATAQQSSFGGGGFGAGGLIQKAGYGGVGMGGGPLSGGGNGSGRYGGVDRGPAPLSGRGGTSGAGGGGQFTDAPPEAAGKYRPERKLTDRDLSDSVVNTIAGEARASSRGGIDAVINNMMNRVGSKGWGPSRDLQDVARAPGQYEGYNPRTPPALASRIRERIKAIASGGVPDNTNGSNSFRASWYRGPWWQRYGQHGKDVGGNTFAYQPGAPNGPYAPYKDPKSDTPAAVSVAPAVGPRGVDGQEGVDIGNGLMRMPNGAIRSKTAGGRAAAIPKEPNGPLSSPRGPLSRPADQDDRAAQRAPKAPDEYEAFRAWKESEARAGRVGAEDEDDAAAFKRWKSRKAAGPLPPRRPAGQALLERVLPGGGRGRDGVDGASGGKGTLHVKFDGLPKDAKVTHSLDGLFRETRISRNSSQMDLA